MDFTKCVEASSTRSLFAVYWKGRYIFLKIRLRGNLATGLRLWFETKINLEHYFSKRCAELKTFLFKKKKKKESDVNGVAKKLDV